MKRIICFIWTAWWLTMLPIAAQVPEIGWMGGITVSQVDGDPYTGYYKAGAVTGGYARLGIGHYAGIQAELRYTGKGSSDGNQVEGTNTYYRLNLHYLEMPVLFQYVYRSAVSLELGPAVGWLMGYTEKDENGMMLDADPFRDVELSGVAGVMYRLTDRLAVGARFSYSVFPVREHVAGATWYMNRGHYNNLLTFCFYYRLWPPF